MSDYESKWTQATRTKKLFIRTTCPICGVDIPKDNGYGQMEIDEYCPTERSHYSYFSSIFGTWLRVGGKEFERHDVKAIDDHLDTVGNKEFVR